MTTKDSAREIISDLIDRFEEQYESYKRSGYNETLTRKDFIDPFFSALGWDMNNAQGFAEAYREVIHEDKIRISGAIKAPDYSFRLSGGKRLFFVEAKKPHIVVKDEIIPAYQIRRYGWSAKLPISIITDFEEFAVYDCTKKPLPADKASVARIRYITFRDYLKEFEFIYDTFSKEKVLKGSFDKFVASTANKKGTTTVDKEFLQSLDEWRTYLATSISWNNKNLDEDEINFVVQQTIDRLIFLRIAEDRSVEPYGNLKHSISSGDYYKNLFDIFHKADEKYNSGIFDFKKDKISENIKVDNKVIKTIINELYYPESPYEFSVLSVEILGNAYEQFLGKQIRIDSAHRAKIEEKPEVRKAGGVYYTPQYIVDYIVKNTVGKLIEGKTPKEISEITIADIACGSGSFLLGAYQYLLDYHKDYYTRNGPASKGKKDNPLTPEGHLTTAEKKRILQNNIYGVDIDVNAVEVTKLSLLLKCMEGETEASIASQMSLWNERVLPSLENNIKSGNSLIDVDFYEGKFDFGEDKKIKPFNWKTGFPNIFSQGGFDIVVGNPPWGADLSDESLDYLRSRHNAIIVRMIDSYMYFINHSLELLKKDGSFGMIIPSTFLNQSDVQLLRKLIAEKFNLEIVINLGEKVFGPKVLNTSTILVFTKSPSESSPLYIADLRDVSPEEKERNLNSIQSTDKSQWTELVKKDGLFTYFTFSTSNVSLLKKLQGRFATFRDIIDGEIQRGISPDYSKAFVLNANEAAEKKIEKKILRPLVLGKHIQRFNTIHTNDVILYLTSKDNINDYPNAKKHLSEFKKFITCREVAEGKHPWFALHRPRNPEIFSSNKFIGLTTTKKLTVAYDEFGFYATDSLYLFKTKSGINVNVVLAIFHSKLFQFLYDTLIQGGQRVIPQVKAVYLNELPFPINGKQESGLANLVKQLQELNKEKEELKLENKLIQIQSKIDFCEEKINQIVYQLYELTPEEIKIVQGTNQVN